MADEKTIEITEEFQIPGTKIILEAGDEIQLKEAALSLGVYEKELTDIIEMITGRYMDNEEGMIEAGEIFGAEVYSTAAGMFDRENFRAFVRGLQIGVQ